MTNLSPLCPALNAAMLGVFNEIYPHQYMAYEGQYSRAIVYTMDYEVVNTIEKIRNFRAQHGRTPVWTGASENTIYGDPAGNHAFRAVHDWIHLEYNLDFTEQHEAMVLLIQNAMLTKYMIDRPTEFAWQEIIDALKYMEADLCGIVAYHKIWGEYPADQRGYVEAYFIDKETALSTHVEAYQETTHE